MFTFHVSHSSHVQIRSNLRIILKKNEHPLTSRSHGEDAQTRDNPYQPGQTSPPDPGGTRAATIPAMPLDPWCKPLKRQSRNNGERPPTPPWVSTCRLGIPHRYLRTRDSMLIGTDI
jgi:hypothetical protein